MVEQPWQQASIASTKCCDEIRRQIQKMITNRLIQPSQAKAWSQVLLVIKPDSHWRFCVDYLNISAITKIEREFCEGGLE